LETSLLDEIKAEAQNCRRCGLRAGCSQVVFGDGNPGADLMLVGEGPGAQEDQEGIPFVGKAGQLLNKILEASGFNRREVYIANIVKCRPPQNRTPTAAEAMACKPYLDAQIAVIKPKIIVCLGSPATKYLIDPGAAITKVRGRWFVKDGINYIPTFHPAALLRDPVKKRPVWEDFQKIRDTYAQIKEEK